MSIQLETLLHEPLPLPSERSTGLVLATALVVAAVLTRNIPWVPWAAAGASALLAILSLTAPRRLVGINRAWMGLAQILARIVNPVVMLALFCIAIVPFGIGMQLVRDPLRRKRRSGAGTYWRTRTPEPAASMRNQF